MVSVLRMYVFFHFTFNFSYNSSIMWVLPFLL